jgi:AmmeMemoRadiSam system protein A
MFLLSSNDGRVLLDLARRAIASAVTQKTLPEFTYPAGLLDIRAGAFVTLRYSGKLRGCVGQVEDPGPVADTVARAAINAALHDTRFFPLAADEIDALEIEVSVLSPLEPLAPETIIVGLHGLMVDRSGQRGLLLPQVAAERQWSSRRFLEETCAKAGLPDDSWKDPDTRILGFTVQVFSESCLRATSNT